MPLQQGDCVHLPSTSAFQEPVSRDPNLYQVIGVDEQHNRCWVRRWPLASDGSPVFEISLQQVRPEPHSQPLRSLQPS